MNVTKFSIIKRVMTSQVQLYYYKYYIQIQRLKLLR
eukprot:SAG31_NODE_769_length_12212_cov_5.357508_3_plen_36_part_00